MSDMEEVLRKNPKAAKELELDAVKDVIDALQELRRVGVAKGDTLRPLDYGRQSLSALKAQQSIRGLKLTVGA